MAESIDISRVPPITAAMVRETVSRIASRFHPDTVILFGSRAWGQPRPDSDIDLLVVMETGQRPALQSAEISIACRPRFVPMDIVVRTPAEIRSRLAMGDPFVTRVMGKGKVLYERGACPGVGQEG